MQMATVAASLRQGMRIVSCKVGGGTMEQSQQTKRAAGAAPSNPSGEGQVVYLHEPGRNLPGIPFVDEGAQVHAVMGWPITGGFGVGVSVIDLSLSSASKP